MRWLPLQTVESWTILEEQFFMMGREGKEQSFVKHLLCGKESDGLKIFFKIGV